jgi:hypothetical protein
LASRPQVDFEHAFGVALIDDNDQIAFCRIAVFDMPEPPRGKLLCLACGDALLVPSPIRL